MDYRPDIDGLRALAVALVVAFHIQMPGFQAGFIGVDIFYVISGYLISGLLLRELREAGTVNLGAFYARRIRRLAPAIVVVLISILMVAPFVLDPLGQQQALATATLASLAFVANIFFARTTGGYFDTPDTEVYLLHFWSLSVEEQFYLVWPLALGGLWVLASRKGGSWVLLAGTTAVVVGSFAWCIEVLDRNPNAAYFLMPSRIWQLLCGAILAISLQGKAVRLPAWAGGILYAGALGALVAALVLIDGPHDYPGALALLPTLAAAGCIGAGVSGSRNAATAVLSHPAVVALGKISFPWYLWHWPMIAMARSYTLATGSLVRDTGMAAAALLLASLTYRYVEQPLHSAPVRLPADRARIFKAGALALATVGVLAGALGYAGRHASRLEGWWQLDPEIKRARVERPVYREACHQGAPFAGLSPKDRCVTGHGSGGIRAVLWGDSHADHWSPLADEFGRQAGLGILQRSFSSCPPLVGYYAYLDVRDQGHCRRFQDAVLDEIRSIQGLRGVILAAYWKPVIDSMHKMGLGDEVLRASLAETVGRLRALGLRVLIMKPTPDLPFDAPSCLARRTPSECGTAQDAWEVSMRSIDAAIDQVAAASPSVHALDLTPYFCGMGRCEARQGGVIMFRDKNHIAPPAAEGALTPARAALEWVTGP